MNKPFVLCAGVALWVTPAVFAESVSSAEIAELRRQVEALQTTVGNLQQQVARSRLAPALNDPYASPPISIQGTSPGVAGTGFSSEGIAKKTNLSIFNPEISAALDVIGSYSKRTKNVNFIARDAEVMLQANVDELAHAYAVFNAETELTPQEKTGVFDKATLGIEEAAIETTALPFGLGLKAGQFFADVTRLGKVHSHELPFTDRPLSLDKIVGGEAKGRGIEMSWVPSIGHYVRFTVGALDNLGAEQTITGSRSNSSDTFAKTTTHRDIGDLTYYTRAATIFELGPQSQLNVGANYLRGNNTGRRQLVSGDFLFSSKPKPTGNDLLEISGEYLSGKSSGLFASPFVTASGDTSGSASAKGGYIYAQYRFGKKWQPGIRFDHLRADSWSDDGVSTVTRSTETTNTSSAYLNYHFSEFNRLRLQINQVRSDMAPTDLQVFLQWSVVLGPHKHAFLP